VWNCGESWTLSAIDRVGWLLPDSLFVTRAKSKQGSVKTLSSNQQTANIN